MKVMMKGLAVATGLLIVAMGILVTIALQQHIEG